MTNLATRGYAPPALSPETDAGISFDAVTQLLQRHRLLVAVSALALGGVVAGYGLSQDRSYSSRATFIAQASKGSNGMSGLAAQFGVALPVSDAAQSPQFYVDLLHSNQVLSPIAMGTYTVQIDGRPVTGDLASFFRISDSRPAFKRDKVLKALNRRIYSVADAKTGVVTLNVSAPYPTLAQQLAVRLLDQLNTFNLTGRRSRATQERKFTEERMLAVGAELRVAEARLEQFLETNREYRLSPKLTLQQDRLSRDVAMRQQVYSSLAQSYEQAKIDEVRDLPVITTISEPEAAVVPDPRGLLLKTLFAMVLGAGIGLALGFLREWRARRRLTA
jgi:uncharacterized protein involved in exopolysaccharide biosynthesis